MLKLIENGKDKTVVDEQNTDGLMEFSINHEIKDTKAYLNYVGPKIPKEEWAKILSFFKWTYDTWKSESQVRLFVNLTDQTWMAWAFPQEADTGMSARELDNDEAKAQRAQISDDWLYFGTVHHHCGCSAFQSGTDRSNEENQDGIHITVGKMDEKVHDIHARFYRKKWKLEGTLDMSVFWDVSDVIATLPEFAKKLMPSGWADKLAREQMCQPSTAPFPEQWKLNVITKPKPENTATVFPTVYGNNGYSQRTSRSYGWSGSHEPEWKRAQSAWSDIVDECATAKVSRDALMKAINKMMSIASPVGIVSGALHRHKISVEELFEEMRKMPVHRTPTPSMVGGGIPVDKQLPDMDALEEQAWNHFCGGGIGD